MAFGKSSGTSKQGQQRQAEPDKRQPEFVIRAKVGDYWQTIGAAWTAKLKDDAEGLSVKINMIPTGWNGDCLMMPPLQQDDR